MLKKLFIIFVLIVVGFVIAVAIRPADFSITRSATIAAPPAAVFGKVNDFHQWEAWSPWAKLDPNMKTTFEGPTEGKGSVYTWAGDNKVGEGRMVISESRPPELIRIDLTFMKPMAANNLTEFTFKPEANGTLVTWSMSGKNSFGGKAFDLIMNMDKVVGSDFEKGLAQLKAAVESAPK